MRTAILNISFLVVFLFVAGGCGHNSTSNPANLAPQAFSNNVVGTWDSNSLCQAELKLNSDNSYSLGQAANSHCTGAGYESGKYSRSGNNLTFVGTYTNGSIPNDVPLSVDYSCSYSISSNQISLECSETNPDHGGTFTAVSN